MDECAVYVVAIPFLYIIQTNYLKSSKAYYHKILCYCYGGTTDVRKFKNIQCMRLRNSYRADGGAIYGYNDNISLF